MPGPRRGPCPGTEAAEKASLPPVEGGGAVGVVAGDPSWVVGPVVVEGAQELAVGQVGPAALRPGLLVVMGFAPGGRHVTAVGGAVTVPQAHGIALGR